MLNENTKKNKFKPGVIILILVAAILFALIILVAFTLLKYGIKLSKENLLKTLKDSLYWKLVGTVFIGVGGYILVNVVMNKLGKKPKEYTEGEDADFLSEDELKKRKGFIFTTFNNLGEVRDGTVIRAEKLKRKKDIEIVMTDDACHVLTIGTTGSGKTTGYIDPIIQILSRTKTKPSLIVADVKGELYKKHYKTLKKQGYNVHVINLREPYKSSRWNPFDIVIKKLKKIMELEEDDSRAAKIKVQTLEDEITDDAREIIYAICPIDEKASDKYWNEGARDFILGVVYAFIEDIRMGEMDADKLTLFNLHFNINQYLQGQNFDIMISYLSERDKFSLATAKASSVLSSVKSEKTLASFVSNISSYISKFSDKAILYMTAQNDLDMKTFDEEPSCLFIQVPDEKVSRHFLVTILLEQAYKELIEKANENCDAGFTDDYKLKRRVYYLLDEFCNFPKINDFNTVISVSRSRGIFFYLIVQNYEQLEGKYKTHADTIKNNCPMKVFLGSDSVKTMKEFQELGGYRKGESLSVSKGESKNLSYSHSVKSIPLVTISELKQINSKGRMGNALISMFGLPLMISKFTPSYLTKGVYSISYEDDGDEKKKEAEIFDREEALFDIKTIYEKVQYYKAESKRLTQELMKAQKKEQEFLQEKEQVDVEEEKTKAAVKELLQKLETFIEHEVYIALLESLENTNYEDMLAIIKSLLNSETALQTRLKLLPLEKVLTEIISEELKNEEEL